MVNSKKETNPDKTAPRKRVLIIDSHEVVRKGIACMVEEDGEFEICGEAGDARQGLRALEELAPDLVVVDVSLPGMNGIEFIKSAKAYHPKQPIVVFSIHDESLYAERALRAGALGYVMKTAACQEILAAFRKALAGEVHVSGRVNGALLQRFLGGGQPGEGPPVSALSDRELEIFESIGHGKTTREIARALNLSVKTVDSHRMHIKEKLAIKTAPELVQRAVHFVEAELGRGALAPMAGV
jgi:DNA-binding NarL/FixJ family response regulator